MSDKLRVLVVDDSAFMRKLLTDIIESDPECQVVKTAGDGVEALRAVKELRPDVVTLDLELPEIDGLTCLVYIMNEFPTPVIVITGFSEFLGEETVKCLEYGAVDFVRKPVSGDITQMRGDLLSRVKLASRVDAGKLRPVNAPEVEKRAEETTSGPTNTIVTIASSTGGARALSNIIPKLPADLPAGVLVVQHMPKEFIGPFTARLNSISRIEVKVAEDLECIRMGTALVSPDRCHITVQSTRDSGEVVRIVPVPKEDKGFLHARADGLMVSAARVCGKSATGVVLTGMGNDGTEGLRAIREYGGTTIAEHESTAVVYGMPRTAIEAGVVDKSVPLQDIADEIVNAVVGSPLAVR